MSRYTSRMSTLALSSTPISFSCSRCRAPAFDFPGAWFLLGEDQELHLIGDRATETQGAGSRGNHWALMIDDMDAWEAHLQAKSIPYQPRKTRPDGAFQIYVTDPDGHVLELCTPPGTA